MKIIKTRWFPFGGYSTINLFGVLFTKQDKLSERTITHETIHTKQMKEMLYVFFYLWYGIEYLIVRFFHKKQNDSYHDVSFEEEAYTYENYSAYPDSRKHYAWFKFLKVRSYKGKTEK